MPNLTAQSIIDRINAQLPPRTDSGFNRDFIHAGDPQTIVTGIATTFLATMEVLESAVRRKVNFIITHEPTYFQDADPKDLAGLHVYEEKRKFIEESKLVIWRLHDGWHRRSPDGIYVGMTRALQWAGRSMDGKDRVFDLPETSLGELVSDIKRKLKIDRVRLIGDSGMEVKRVAMAVGSPGWPSHKKLLATEGLDVLVIGEGAEWEVYEYVRDSQKTEKPLGLIVLGHAMSEEAGMEFAADWVRDLISDIPVEFIAAGSPFRSV